MRSYQVFAGLAPQHAEQVLTRLAEKAPAMFVQALAAASAALKARPVYLQRQPFPKRAEAVRRTSLASRPTRSPTRCWQSTSSSVARSCSSSGSICWV